ncbi:efflux RND transporter periplasmic adaptor subunit [Tabrizicola sp.]|uniref:efflux RND transporter periplasmic adaptor subunit n=1 Tax=Tabrizicola sp. TaxID=2005166 RepID=UPI001A5F1EF0|nr:efflux RND transporter periplasmic adaptor subunit [Tabrizicola sp.]MBL9061211.1 efflux RND transporter periplasmic adaptor subunit [Tabrizicola sp.]
MARLPGHLLLSLMLGAAALPVGAEPVTLAPVTVTEWKAVYGTVEARDRIPARARIGGTLVALSAAEGDLVEAGQELARIVDDKLDFQLAALAAQKEALAAQLANAGADLQRGEDLLKNGVTTTQRVDALRTQVDVLTGQIASLDAQAEVVAQQAKEGVVLAPVAGRVLDVPQTKGAVVMPGEVVAVVGGGGTFLRIAVPERHATALTAGDAIRVSEGGEDREGRLARVYPLIEGGRVVADVEIEGLPDSFVGARMLVRLPVGERKALLVPKADVVTRAGLDFVGVQGADGAALRTIVPGEAQVVDGVEMVEVISGLSAGDVVVPASEVGHE